MEQTVESITCNTFKEKLFNAFNDKQTYINCHAGHRPQRVKMDFNQDFADARLLIAHYVTEYHSLLTRLREMHIPDDDVMRVLDNKIADCVDKMCQEANFNFDEFDLDRDTFALTFTIGSQTQILADGYDKLNTIADKLIHRAFKCRFNKFCHLLVFDDDKHVMLTLSIDKRGRTKALFGEDAKYSRAFDPTYVTKYKGNFDKLLKAMTVISDYLEN